MSSQTDVEYLWKSTKFYTMNKVKEEVSGIPSSQEQTRQRQAEQAGSKVQRVGPNRSNQSLERQTSATCTKADGTNFQTNRNVSRYDDLVAPGDENAEADSPNEKEQSCDHAAAGDELVVGNENNQINPHRYNFLDLVDRPFCSEEDLQNFVKSNQQWALMKARVQDTL